MSYIRRTPRKVDPRNWDVSPHGYLKTGVVPWRYQLGAVDATGLFPEISALDVFLEVSYYDEGHTYYTSIDTYPSDLVVRFNTVFDDEEFNWPDWGTVTVGYFLNFSSALYAYEFQYVWGVIRPDPLAIVNIVDNYIDPGTPTLNFGTPSLAPQQWDQH